MLKMIDETLNDLLESTDNQVRHITIYVTKLLGVMESGVRMSAKEIMKKLNLKSKEKFRKNYMNPALKAGLVCVTILENHQSKNQRYYKI